MIKDYIALFLIRVRMRMRIEEKEGMNMPTTYAHYQFGKDVIRTLPGPLQKAIENHRQLFDIGLYGPDIFFYYRIFHKNRVNAIGYRMHEEYADSFFEHAAEVIKTAKNKSAARAYIYGFICHFALDSECHKYVEKMIQVSGITHSEIEMEFDRMILVRKHIDPMTFHRANCIHPSIKNAEVIAEFFDGVSAKEIRKTLKYMILCDKLLTAPNPIKRKALFFGMKVTGQYEGVHGMVMSEQPNPACKKYCQILNGVYNGAVPIAGKLIGQYQKVLFKNEEISKRFHETFGAGENWQELQV